jgi:hypothetical protein
MVLGAALSINTAIAGHCVLLAYFASDWVIWLATETIEARVQ